VTDRQIDGQNYDSQDGASIAASRGKNTQDTRTDVDGKLPATRDSTAMPWLHVK